ncbi:hypothetical protein D3C71_970530 [compost metagenome]
MAVVGALGIDCIADGRERNRSLRRAGELKSDARPLDFVVAWSRETKHKFRVTHSR